MVKPLSKGRRKIEMKKIQQKSNLGVTFTKRRNGIFKKANELVALCGAQVAVIIFSPGKKPYSYGHPNVYTILSRVVGNFTDFPELLTSNNNVDEEKKEKINELFEIYNLVNEQVDVEKMNAKKDKEICTMQLKPRNQLSYEQSMQLRAMVLDLKMLVATELQKINATRSQPGFNHGEPSGTNASDVMYYSPWMKGSNIVGHYNYGPFVSGENDRVAPAAAETGNSHNYGTWEF